MSLPPKIRKISMHLVRAGDQEKKVPKGSQGWGPTLESLGHLGLQYFPQGPGSLLNPESGTEIFGLL